MLLRYFYDDRLAQASYLVGCNASGTAVVVDPARNITPYLQVAQENGLQITHIAETHIHADFVSGSRELALVTGAQICVSGEGGEAWTYSLPETNVRVLKDGDKIQVGNVYLTALHTPGHTPEHISYLLTDGATTDKPMGIFSGDCLFVGDIGRPDLLEKVVSHLGTSDIGARQQFRNVQLFKQMPDYIQVFPAHGAGSACGKALGALPSSTLGYEKLVNPAFQINEEQAFVDWLLSGQPEPPVYFAQMKHVNKVGPALLKDLAQPQHIKEAPDTDIVPENALFIDTRPASDYLKKHLPNTVNIPISSKSFNTYVGWYVNYSLPTFFIAYKNDVMSVLDALFAIGVDDIPGYFTSEVLESAVEGLPELSPKAVYEANMPILDVRNVEEYNAVHIPNAQHIYMGYVVNRLNELPKDTPFAVQCAGGARSQVVVSLLHKMGYTQAVNMQGGIDAWQKEGLPVVQG